MSPVRNTNFATPFVKISNGVRAGSKLNKQEKLRRNCQFMEVYTRGRRLSGPHLTIFFIVNQLKVNRLGLSVRKKRFKLSTDRHYIQRRLREAYRLTKRRFLPGHDIVISAQRFNKGKTSFEEIKSELLSLAQKARLIKPDTPGE